MGQFHNPAQREEPAYLACIRTRSVPPGSLLTIAHISNDKEDGISNVHNIGSGKGIPAC